MSTTTANPNAAAGETLVDDRWVLVLRGVLGVAFGGIALVMPVATIVALLLLFSAYMLVDGCFSLYAAVRAMRRHDRWSVPLFQGLASIVAGAVAFFWPGITILVFVLLLAAWSIVSGCLMLAAARNIEGGRGWLIFGGVVSLLYGALMILSPLIGAVVLTWWLGAYSLVLGVAMIVLAFRLRPGRDRRQV